MPVKQSIDTEQPLVYTVFSGEVTDADFDEHFRSLSSDPRFVSTMPELVDLRDVTRVSLSRDTIASSARWPLHAYQARRAVVAPTDFLFGLARMYQAYRGLPAEGYHEVFRDMPAALEWLGLSELPSTVLA